MEKRRTVYKKFVFPSFLIALIATLSFIQQASAFGTIIEEFDGLMRPVAGPTHPNVSGDVGLNHYIQAVDGEIAIYPKDSTGVPVDSDTFNNFFDGATMMGDAAGIPACDDFNRGQPQVFFDQMAARWLITDVAYTDADTDNGPYYQCVAVSNSTSPTTLTDADWFQWAFEIHADYLHDQPKFGVWPDGYYMAADLYDVWNNGLHRTPKGVAVWAFNRNDLVAGNPSPQTEDFYISESFGFNGLLPSNLLGTPPPNGTPNYFAAVQPPNKLLTWQFDVDWINTSNSTFTGPETTFVNNFTWPSGYQAPQGGSAENLDIVGQRLMQPLQYRYQTMDEFGNINVEPTLWANHTVGQDNGTTGIRWYEIRDPGGDPPSVFQQGTYAETEDTAYRWLGSMATDRYGNMALAYSKSSSTMDPGIYQTGRLVDDPLGQLQPEMSLWSGDESQDLAGIAVDGPWGLYSHMTVDPYDDCNFWYTNQYYNTITGVDIWRTRVTNFALADCDPFIEGVITRQSLDSDNNEAFGGGSGIYNTAISGDGRWVVFDSEANNLVDDDDPNPATNHVDVFLRDRDADGNGIFDEDGGVETTLISRSIDLGLPPANGDSGVGVTGDFGGNTVDISQDGRYVVFSSEASDLVSGDTNGTVDVFLFDRNDVTDTNNGITRISVGASGQGNAVSDQPSISNDGRYVAFRSFSSNLVATDANFLSDIFLRDVIAGTTVLVSVDGAGVQGDGHSYNPAIAAGSNGRYVSFTSNANNLSALDTGPAAANDITFADVFVRDTVAPGTSLVSVNAAGGAEGDARSYHSSISDDGQYVAFASQATDLVAGDVNGFADIFVRDSNGNGSFEDAGDTTTRVSVDILTGLIGGNRDSYRPAISGNGMYVAFESDASDFLPGDTNGLRDLYVADRTDFAEMRRITFGYDGSEANGHAFWPHMNQSGQHTAFTSDANNLVNDDTNNLRDVFTHDRDAVPPLGPMLYVPQDVALEVLAGSTIDVPIAFAGHSHDISSVAFTVDMNNPCLSFDSTDDNSDGVPDDVNFTLPAGYAYSATYDAADLSLQLTAYDPTNPLTALPDGNIAEITFRAICQPPVNGSQFVNVNFDNTPAATFGNTEGESVAGSTKTGAVEILYNGSGDCNNDGTVDAGDLSALILEIFDGDGNLAGGTGGGTFAGTEYCDANDDSIVDAGDISCTILIIFEGFDGLLTCGTGSTMASPTARAANSFAAASAVALTIPHKLAAPGSEVTLPVSLNPGGQAINATAFSIDIDQALLSFDSSDADANGIPDGVVLNLPAGFNASVSYDATDSDGELDIVIFNMSANPTALPAGELLAVTVTTADVSSASADVAFSLQPTASFGSTAGESISGSVNNGSIQIGSANYRLFLPTIQK
ncbi:MAG: cohesin domain-containing protein [Chloroflexota bacterium]